MIGAVKTKGLTMLVSHLHQKEVLLRAWKQITVPCACFYKNYRPATSESLYDVLGVPLYASDKEIRAAFIELSKKYHPDANTNDKTLHDKFVKISKAYNVLNNPEERRIYDEGLRAGLHVEPGEVSTKQNWNPKHPQYYYHPRFYQDPEMRKMAARVWEKRTGIRFTEYFDSDNYKQEEHYHHRPKHLGLKTFAITTTLMSFGLLLAYMQYRNAQYKVNYVRQSVNNGNARNEPSAGARTSPIRKSNKGTVEEKDLTEDKIAGPLHHIFPEGTKT